MAAAGASWPPTHRARDARWMGHGYIARGSGPPGRALIRNKSANPTRKGKVKKRLFHPSRVGKRRWRTDKKQRPAASNAGIRVSHPSDKNKDVARMGHPKFRPSQVGNTGGGLIQDLIPPSFSAACEAPRSLPKTRRGEFSSVFRPLKRAGAAELKLFPRLASPTKLAIGEGCRRWMHSRG